MTATLNVLFVCQHGAAKSVIAARHLEKLALARGLTVNVAAAGVEPDDVIPPHVIAGLLADGIAESGDIPQPVTHDLIRNSQLVVSFGCNLASLAGGSSRIIEWTDVPAVSDGYETARAAILDRLNAILDEVDDISSGTPPAGLDPTPPRQGRMPYGT